MLPVRNCGRIGARSVGRKAQRRAISMVFASASGRSAKSCHHLGLRLLEIVLGAQAPALVDRDIAAFGDADQRVMRLEIVRAGEIGLVGGDDGEVEIVGEIEQRSLDRPFRRQAMPLQLDIEPVAEQRVQRVQARAGKIGIARG